MNVSDSISSTAMSITANQSRSVAHAIFDRTGNKTDKPSSVTDIVEISELYRTMQMYVDTAGEAVGNTFQMNGSTQGSYAGAGVQDLRNYVQNGDMTDVSLASINASREALGRKIDSVLRNAGIQLAKDEKISITVGPNNEVKVTGLKDKDKAKAIEKALSEDKKLTQDIRRHYALGKINKAAKQSNDYASQNPGAAGLDEMFTNRGLRSFVIDDYLQEKAGVSLSDLSVSIADGVTNIHGVNDELAALFAEDATLAKSVANILENGEQTSDFGITFDFANGAIADGDTEAAAKEKVKNIQATIMGLLDEYNANLVGGGGAAAEGMEELMADGFSIRVRKGGGFEIVGAENMSGMKVSNLTAIVNKALSIYGMSGIDPYTGGAAIGNFSDVADAMIESHRFEHGDAEEYGHEVEIALKGFFVDMKVVSEGADKAREEMTQNVAGELGRDLRTLMEENGVDVGEGIKVEIDESGKMKVVGDLSDPNLKHAQAVLDTFAQQAKSAGAAAGKDDSPEATAAQDERGDARSGAPKSERERLEALNRETNPGGSFSPNVAKRDLPDYKDRGGDDDDGASARAALLDGSFRTSGGHDLSMVKSRKYVRADLKIGGNAPSGAGVGGLSLMDEEAKLYSDDAVGKYLRIMDSFGQFHTIDHGRKFTFTIS